MPDALIDNYSLFSELLTSPVVEVTDFTVTSLSVEWGKINEDVVGWTIELTNHNDGEVKVRKIVFENVCELFCLPSICSSFRISLIKR